MFDAKLLLSHVYVIYCNIQELCSYCLACAEPLLWSGISWGTRFLSLLLLLLHSALKACCFTTYWPSCACIFEFSLLKSWGVKAQTFLLLAATKQCYKRQWLTSSLHVKLPETGNLRPDVSSVAAKNLFCGWCNTLSIRTLLISVLKGL